LPKVEISGKLDNMGDSIDINPIYKMKKPIRFISYALLVVCLTLFTVSCFLYSTKATYQVADFYDEYEFVLPFKVKYRSGGSKKYGWGFETDLTILEQDKR
jgi:hypothetical protein